MHTYIHTYILIHTHTNTHTHMPRRSHDKHTHSTCTRTQHTHTHSTHYPTETTPTRVEAARRILSERKIQKKTGRDTETQRHRDTKKIAWKKIFYRQIGRRRDGATNRRLVSVYRGLVSVYRDV